MYKNIFKYDEMKRSEHMAVRQTVGWYYWTHQLIEISGPDVVKLLEYLYPNDIGNIKVGRDRYTTMLNQAGEIIDDVVIMRMAEDRFWISTLFLTYTWTGMILPMSGICLRYRGQDQKKWSIPLWRIR